VHVKDLEAAVTKAHGACTKAVSALSEAKATIAEVDHTVSIAIQLKEAGELQSLVNRIAELESLLETKGK